MSDSGNYAEILDIVLVDERGEARAVMYEDAEEIARDLVKAGFTKPLHAEA